MKLFLLTILFAVIIGVSIPIELLAADTNPLITELKVFDNDSIFRYLYLYDNLGNKVLETKYYSQNTDWIRKTQNEWIYDGTKCVTQRERIWKNGWVVSYQINYEYTDNQLVTETHNVFETGISTAQRKINFEYNSTLLKSKSEYYWVNNAWSLSEVNDFRYLANGKTDSIKTTVYKSGAISEQLLSVFSYNADGKINSQVVKSKSNSVNPNEWTNYQLINWYYKPISSLLISQRSKKWNTETLKWEYTHKIDYQYNGNNNLISETYQRWKTMFWQNDSRYDYDYDTSAKQLHKMLSMPIYNKWRNTISINYSNFTDNKANLMESKYNFWGGNTNELTNSNIPFLFNNEATILKAKKIEISYLTIVDTGVPTFEFTKSIQQIPVYPNPSNGVFYINTQQFNIQLWSISDLSGRTLKIDNNQFNSGVIDLTDLPKGIYILRAITKDVHLTQKLIKE
ncbi:MAG: T9SS type A sorting domain-containing protein [Paludibacter sp.]